MAISNCDDLLVEIVAEVGVELGYLNLKTANGSDIEIPSGARHFCCSSNGIRKKSVLCLVFDRVFGRLSTNERSIAVVISPLIALMEDQVGSFSSRGLLEV